VPWTDPPTFVPDTELTAADLNILGDDLLFLKGVADGVTFSGVQLARSSDQSIPGSTWTSVVWQAEAFDYGGWWTSGAGITVPAGAFPAGYTSIACLVIMRAQFDPNTTATRFIRVTVDDAEVTRVSTVAVGDGETTDLDMSEFVVVEAGQVIKGEAYQNSGGALDVRATNTKITVVRYAPAT
jgi:hypothetical protein